MEQEAYLHGLFNLVPQLAELLEETDGLECRVNLLWVFSRYIIFERRCKAYLPESQIFATYCAILATCVGVGLGIIIHSNKLLVGNRSVTIKRVYNLIWG